MKKINNMEAKLLSITTIGLCGAVAFTGVISKFKRPIILVTIINILILAVKEDK